MNETPVESVTEGEMPIPTSRTLKRTLVLAGSFTFVSGSVGIALFNLASPRSTTWGALVASVIWLLLVSSSVIGLCIDAGGLRMFVLYGLGKFAGGHFVRLQRRPDDDSLACFGYRICGWRIIAFRVPLRGIAKVNWGEGQGSALSGEDWNDWSVCLFYDRGVATPSDLFSGLKQSQGVYLVGDDGPKQAAAEFGQNLVAFLDRCGGEFVQRKDGRTDHFSFERRN